MRHAWFDSVSDTRVWTVHETRVIGRCMRHLFVDSARDTCDWTVYETPVCGQCTRHVWLEGVWDTCFRTLHDTPVHSDDEDCAFSSVAGLAGDENFLNLLLSKSNALYSWILYVHHLIITSRKLVRLVLRPAHVSTEHTDLRPWPAILITLTYT